MKFISNIKFEIGNCHVFKYLPKIDTFIMTINDTLYKINKDLFVTKCIEKSKGYSWRFVDENIFIDDGKGDCQRLDISDCKKLKILEEGIEIFQSPVDLTCIINYTNNTTSLYSFSKNNIYWTKNSLFNFHLIKNSEALHNLYDNSRLLKVFDFNTGDVKWQYSVTPKYDYLHTDMWGQESIEKNDINSIIGEYNGLLWVVL
ncbi:MAG: hypothetical protein IPO92_13550, partial [Saprospiraceae bacterium]|nr:hypothetical protein [Saprospiraceae bacterium]